MNVFRRELRAHRKSLIWWSVAVFLLTASSVAKFYGYSSQGSGASTITEVMNAFPHSLQVLFGLNGFDLDTPSGVYGILFMYIVVTAAIHAVLLGTDLLAKEERDKTVEFVFTKPISRAAVVSQKLLAGLLNVIVINLVTLAASIYFLDYFSKSSAGTSTVLVMDVAILMIQLLFFFVGAAIAAATPNPKAAGGIATSLLLTTFILYYAINLSGHINWLSFFTPFKYFDPHNLISEGLNPGYMVLSVALTFLAAITTYATYQHRDLNH